MNLKSSPRISGQDPNVPLKPENDGANSEADINGTSRAPGALIVRMT